RGTPGPHETRRGAEGVLWGPFGSDSLRADPPGRGLAGHLGLAVLVRLFSQTKPRGSHLHQDKSIFGTERVVDHSHGLRGIAPILLSRKHLVASNTTFYHLLVQPARQNFP